MLCPHIIFTKKPKRGVIKIKLDKRNFEKSLLVCETGKLSACDKCI